MALRTLLVALVVAGFACEKPTPATSTDSEPVAREAVAPEAVAKPSPGAAVPGQTAAPVAPQPAPTRTPNSNAAPRTSNLNAAPPARAFTVRAEVAERRARPRDCGIFHYQEVIRYKVVGYPDGSRVGTDLFVVQSCPGVSPEGRDGKFAIGTVHELSLIPANPTHASSYSDPFTGSYLPRYRARKTRVLSI